MASIKEIMERELQLLVTDIRNNFSKKNRNATGRTSASITYDVRSDGSKVIGEVTAPSHVVELEQGRKPTQGEPTGSSEWYNKLDDWLRARNIPLAAKFPIFRKIHQEGYKGTKGLVTDPVEKSLDRITKRVADAAVENLLKDYK